LFFVVVAAVRIHARGEVQDDDCACESIASAESADAVAAGLEAGSDGAATGSDASSSDSSGVGTAEHVPAVLAPLELLGHNGNLTCLCVVAALVSLPEITLTDVSAQYALNQFGLVHSADTAKQKQVNLLFQWPGYALLLPAFIVTGLLAKRFSALTLMRILIPFTGLLLSLPVLLRVAPRMWIVPIVGIAVPMSMVVFAPLQTLITQVAPAGRVGEAMGAIGASKQVAGLVSNLLVSGLVPILLSLGIPRPLWIFYPLASLSSMTAFAVTALIEAPLSPSAEPTTDKEPGMRRMVSGRSLQSCPRKLATDDDVAEGAVKVGRLSTV